MLIIVEYRLLENSENQIVLMVNQCDLATITYKVKDSPDFGGSTGKFASN